MAIHVRVRKDAILEKKKHDRRRRRIAACVSFFTILALALILRHFIIIYLQENTTFSIYQAVEDRNDLLDAPKARQLAPQAAGATNNIPPVNVIVAITASPVSVQSMPAENLAATSWEGSIGEGMLGMSGLGNGFGGGHGGSGNGGLGSAEKIDSSLKGTLYDLKTLRNGSPSPLATAEGNRKVVDVLSDFFHKGWNRRIFDVYRSAPINLYATCFYVPNCKDSEAPISFKVEDTMQPSRWVAVYRGRVKPPKSGRFRFWGVADSVMAVRFNKKNVLQCGFHTLDGKSRWNTHRYDALCNNRRVLSYPENSYWNELFIFYASLGSIDRPKNMVAQLPWHLTNYPKKECQVVGTVEVPTYDFEQGDFDPGVRRKRVQTGTVTIEKRECRIVGYEDKNVTVTSHMMDSLYALRHDVMEADNLLGGLEEGEEMHLNKDKWYDIEIMVSEIGGGNFGFCLLVEDMDDTSTMREDGRPLLQLFRTTFVNPDPHEFYNEVHEKIPSHEQTYPPYDPDSLIWQAQH